MDELADFDGKIRPNIPAKKISNWLKSLSPQSHWKPSEEQMETLVEAITDEKLEDTASCDKKADILQSLYDDLRKLM